MAAGDCGWQSNCVIYDLVSTLYMDAYKAKENA